MILANGPQTPQYGRVFSQAASLRFFTQYVEYERSVELSNNARSISHPVLWVSQLLPKSIRSCLSRTYLDGTELRGDDLREALAKHAECWTGISIDPSIALAEVCRRVTMGSEATAVDRTDAVQSRLEQYFEKSSGENIFFDARGVFKRGPAAVIRKAFVAGLHPPEFKIKVEGKLDMKGHWKDKREVNEIQQ